jgi:hypothetical protein
MKYLCVLFFLSGFVVQAQIPTVFFQTSAVSLEEGGNYEQVTLLISPALLTDESITLQLDLNGNVGAEDLYTSPEHTNGTLVLNINAGASQVTFNIGAIDGDAMEGAEFTTLTISAASNGLIIGQPSTINIGISEPAVALPSLFINELQSLNTTTIADSNGEYDDWIELYNSGSQDVNLGGMFLSNDKSNGYKYEFPFSVMETTVPSGGYKIIWADSTPDQGALHAAFRLQDEEGWVGLYYTGGAAGAIFRLIDSVAYRNAGAGFSSGRQSDGGTPWVDFEFPTPFGSNQTTSIADDNLRKIKLYPNPVQVGSALMLDGPLVSGVNMSLIAPDGRTVLQKLVLKNQPLIDINAGLAPGIYLLLLQSPSFQSSQRLLISP